MDEPTLNERFVIWCAEKTKKHWKKSGQRRYLAEWMDDPYNHHAQYQVQYLECLGKGTYSKNETVMKAILVAINAALYLYVHRSPQDREMHLSRASFMAELVLTTTEDDLRHAFVAEWSDKELSTTDPEWIEYATVEFINRAVEEGHSTSDERVAA